MAKRETWSRRSTLESDSCPDHGHSGEMERPSGAGIGRPWKGRRVDPGLTESDGCCPVRSTLPSTEHDRDSKRQVGYTGSKQTDDSRPRAGPPWSAGHTVDKSSPEQMAPGIGISVDQMPIDRRSSPEQWIWNSGRSVEQTTVDKQSSSPQRTIPSGTLVDPLTVARQPFGQSDTRTFDSGTSVEQMASDRQSLLNQRPPDRGTSMYQVKFDCRPSPEQRLFGSGTLVDQMMTFGCRSSPEQRGTFADPMAIDRQPSPEQGAFCSGTSVDPMKDIVMQSLARQRVSDRETLLDQTKLDMRSSPEQRTLGLSSMFPSHLDEEEMTEERSQSDEVESRQVTTSMESWSLEDDNVPSPESEPFVDPAIFAQDDDGDTNLHLAIISEHIEQALCLIHLAPYPQWLDLTNHLRQTPLHLATIRRQPLTIRRLLRRGAKRVVHDRHGNTPLHIACLNGHLDCVQELTSSCPASVMTSDDLDFDKPNYEGQTCLHLAASKTQLHVIRHLVEDCGLNVNQKELTRGCTILHQAVRTSNLDLLDYLLKLPSSAELIIDEPTYDGYTALHFARLAKHTHIEQMLLSAGAQPITSDDWPSPQALHKCTDQVMNREEL